MFLWAQQDRHTALLAVTCGLDPQARVGSGQRACVSADPAGLSQGLSQRRSGGHRVRGGPVAWSPANGTPVGAVTRELGNRYLPRSAGWRAHGQRTRGDPAELPRRTPTPTCSGLWRDDERQLPCRGTDKHRNQNKRLSKTNKQNEVKGHCLLFWSGLLSRCTQQGGTRTCRWGGKLKYTVFNGHIKAGLDKARLTWTETPGVTSRPDEIKLNRQDYKYTG